MENSELYTQMIEKIDSLVRENTLLRQENERLKASQAKDTPKPTGRINPKPPENPFVSMVAQVYGDQVAQRIAAKITGEESRREPSGSLADILERHGIAIVRL